VALRVLLVAFYVPPTSGGGVERVLSFARYLPRHGVEVELLAPTDAKWLAEDPTGLARLPAALRLHRVRYRGPSNRVLPGQRLAAAEGLSRLALRARLLPRRALQPDVEVAWLPDLLPAALRLLRSGRFDALLTSAPPHSLALAGALLARRTHLPWIADWRDPWLEHADLDLGRRAVRARTALARPLARAATARMTAATAVNEAIATEIRALRPDLPVAVIPNGVDLEELDEIEARPADRCTLVFSGYFFGDRHPRALLEGLADLLAARPELRARLRLRFLGSFREEDRRYVAAAGLGDVVAIEGNRPRREVLQAQRDAHVLVAFMQDAGGRGHAFVPAKVWEYLAAERPILALVPPAGRAAEVLRSYGTGELVAPGDREGARAALERLVARWEAGTLAGRPLAPEIRRRISRAAGAERLAAVVTEAVARAR
jgi:glycosyltransferase involved in cell wall biosynthesis